MREFFRRISTFNIGLIFLVIACGPPEEVGVISTEFGDIVVEFFPDDAPMHVESFKILANKGYFDSTTFHRVIPGFVIQGGDPNSKDDNRNNDGMGGHAGKFFGIGRKDDPESWMIPSEFNARQHTRGTLSMARSRNPDSAGSQFFICVVDVHQLNGKYSVFGQVIHGLDIVDQIVNQPRDDKDNPLTPVPMIVKIVPRKEALES